MSDMDLVTAEVVRKWATECLEEWLPGWTAPWQGVDPTQFYLAPATDGAWRVGNISGSEEKFFKVTVTVEKEEA